jgi:ArsR family transcriptional regulator
VNVAPIPERCRPVLEAPLEKIEAEQLASAFKVLADAARLRLLSLIATRPEREACVCHLTGSVGLTQPTVTHHLQVLHEAGLLARERRGIWVYYRILPDRLASLKGALTNPTPLAEGASRETNGGEGSSGDSASGPSGEVAPPSESVT